MRQKDILPYTIIIVVLILIFSIVSHQLSLSENIPVHTDTVKSIHEPEVNDNVVVVDSFGRYSMEVMNRVGQFSVQALSNNVISKIKGVSWNEGAPVELEDLAHVEVTYWGFDGEPHLGELIVHAKLAEEVAAIFQDLYEAKFPIEKIRLVDEYEANDDFSMMNNNTAAFNYRIVTGGQSLSKHSYGMAIDINPIQNPYVKGNLVSPEEGRAYLSREDHRPGMIIKNDLCYDAFVSRGWTWGGEWNSLKDYQHFEKDIPLGN